MAGGNHHRPLSISSSFPSGVGRVGPAASDSKIWDALVNYPVWRSPPITSPLVQTSCDRTMIRSFESNACLDPTLKDPWHHPRCGSNWHPHRVPKDSQISHARYPQATPNCDADLRTIIFRKSPWRWRCWRSTSSRSSHASSVVRARACRRSMLMVLIHLYTSDSLCQVRDLRVIMGEMDIHASGRLTAVQYGLLCLY
jgi:hypothetical protein